MNFSTGPKLGREGISSLTQFLLSWLNLQTKQRLFLLLNPLLFLKVQLIVNKQFLPCTKMSYICVMFTHISKGYWPYKRYLDTCHCLGKGRTINFKDDSLAVRSSHQTQLRLREVGHCSHYHCPLLPPTKGPLHLHNTPDTAIQWARFTMWTHHTWAPRSQPAYDSSAGVAENSFIYPIKPCIYWGTRSRKLLIQGARANNNFEWYGLQNEWVSSISFKINCTKIYAAAAFGIL